jgi:hypothetical protein
MEIKNWLNFKHLGVRVDAQAQAFACARVALLIQHATSRHIVF